MGCNDFTGGLNKYLGNYIPLIDMDIINYPCHNPDAGLANIS